MRLIRPGRPDVDDQEGEVASISTHSVPGPRIDADAVAGAYDLLLAVLDGGSFAGSHVPDLLCVVAMHVDLAAGRNPVLPEEPHVAGQLVVGGSIRRLNPLHHAEPLSVGVGVEERHDL